MRTAEHYSTLELVEHDQTATAPERGYAATAFELNGRRLGPKVLPGTAPQFLYRHSLPAVNLSIEKSMNHPAGRAVPKSVIWWTRIIVAFVVVVVVVAAVAIGVEVGIRHTRRNHSSTISPIVASASIPNLPTPPRPTHASTLPAPPPSSTSPAPPPAYATGVCCFHLQEWQDCSDPSKDLFAIVNMVDNNKNEIGFTVTNPDENPLGESINPSDPYSFTSELSYTLIIVGEHENDSVQFTYRSLHWTSMTKSGLPNCRNGGWYPVDGPVCNGNSGNTPAENQMDCCFPC